MLPTLAPIIVSRALTRHSIFNPCLPSVFTCSSALHSTLRQPRRISMARDGERTERSERGRGGRGRNRGGTRDRAPMDRETQVSKKLSWLLRHGAEKEGLRLGRGGYVGLADVVSASVCDGAGVVVWCSVVCGVVWCVWCGVVWCVWCVVWCCVMWSDIVKILGVSVHISYCAMPYRRRGRRRRRNEVCFPGCCESHNETAMMFETSYTYHESRRSTVTWNSIHKPFHISIKS